MGGWRIIKTMGSRIIKMDAAQGFAAQGSGAAVILAATHVGFPLSTTHTISGAVMGAGAAKRLSAVRWGVAGNIVVAWVLTLPASAAIGAATYGVTRIFGTGAAGPVVVSVAILARDRRWCSRAALQHGLADHGGGGLRARRPGRRLGCAARGRVDLDRRRHRGHRVFAVAILGATRAIDLRQGRQPGCRGRLRGAHRDRAGRRGGLVVLGILVMTSK